MPLAGEDLLQARVVALLDTHTKVVGGSALGSPMPRQAAASCVQTQNCQPSNQTPEFELLSIV